MRKNLVCVFLERSTVRQRKHANGDDVLVVLESPNRKRVSTEASLPNQAVMWCARLQQCDDFIGRCNRRSVNVDNAFTPAGSKTEMLKPFLQAAERSDTVDPYVFVVREIEKRLGGVPPRQVFGVVFRDRFQLIALFQGNESTLHPVGVNQAFERGGVGGIDRVKLRVRVAGNNK